MDMSSPPLATPREEKCRESRPATGRGTRTPALPRLLAIHGARQRSSRTAALMRQGDPPRLERDEPARMLAFYSGDTRLAAQQPWARGAFHTAVAAMLSAAARAETSPGGAK